MNKSPKITYDLNQSAGTIFSIIRGPLFFPVTKIRKNVYANGASASDVLASYTLTVIGLGTATIQGTNDVVVTASGGGGSGSQPKPYAFDAAPSSTASWANVIQQIGAGTNTTTIPVTGVVEFAFLRLVVTTQGVGTVTEASAVWD